jgi:ornithine carrier protein
MQVQMLSAGALAGAASGALPRVRNLQGPLSILASVVHTNGVRGLWLGQTGTLLRESGGSAAWFTTNEFVSGLLIARHEKERGFPARSLSKKDLEPWELGLSGACAGIAYNVSLFPADTIKSAMQTEEELRPRGPGVPRPTFAGTFVDMYKAQGVRGLYAGLGVTVARSAPSSAMIFLIYDGLNKHFG